MKEKVLTAIFTICAIFILMGIGTILKGDIENLKEAMFITAFLLFFISLMLASKWQHLLKIVSPTFDHTDLAIFLPIHLQDLISQRL